MADRQGPYRLAFGAVSLNSYVKLAVAQSFLENNLRRQLYISDCFT